MTSSLSQTRQTKAQFWAQALREGIPAVVGIVLGALITFAVMGRGDWEFLVKLVAVPLLLTPIIGALRVILNDYYRGTGGTKE